MFKKFILIIVGCLMTFNVFGQTSKDSYLGGTFNLIHTVYDNEEYTDFAMGGEFGAYVSKSVSLGIFSNIIVSDFRDGFEIGIFGEWNKELCANVYYAPRLSIGYLERLYGEDFYSGYSLTASLVGLNCQVTNRFVIRIDMVNAINENVKINGNNVSYTRLEISPSIKFRWVY